MTEAHTGQDKLLTDHQVSEILGVAVATLRRWRWQGIGPRWVKIGSRAVRYRASDIAAFALADVRGPAPKAAA